MEKTELQQYLEKNIPLYRKAGFKVSEINDGIATIFGELEENRNPHHTVFGGSISAILLISSWCKVYEIMNRTAPESSIVVSSQKVDYLKPVDGDFEGVARTPDSVSLNGFLESYHSRGKGRLNVSSELYLIGSKEVCARFEGEFFVKKR